MMQGAMSKRSMQMSYTLNIESDIVKEAESCARRNGTTLDAMIRACLVVIVSHDMAKGSGALQTEPGILKIGSMRDEVKLPANFDDVFDSLDGEIATMFNGAVV